jgi:hydroxyquinol 1,2-dioxygenase
MSTSGVKSSLALTEQVVASFQTTDDERLRSILTQLIHHLHGFVREVALTPREWETAIAFLTQVGHKCDDVRQEFVLLSDVLGVSMLIETLNDQHTTGATDSTVLGPFHMTESPARQHGEHISSAESANQLVVTGTVRSTGGEPLADVSVDVWQSDDNGFYDVQQPSIQPAGNGRGLFRSDADGRFWFHTVMPSYYGIPTDGPVGTLLAAAGRHPYRPAHIHFIAETSGYQPLTTHIFIPGSPYLDSDAVFAVKQSLIGELGTVSAEQAAQLGAESGTPTITVDLVLAAA